jgi:hypothetical protein
VHSKTPARAHARHRARSAQDPTRANVPPTILGVVYPLDDVVAVIDDRESAERAVRSLRDAGLPEEDVELLDGPFVVEASRSCQKHSGRLQRIEAWLSTAFSDDVAYAKDYLLQAERGHYLLIVHAQRQDVVERVRELLHAEGAHDMRHYELLTVTDLW